MDTDTAASVLASLTSVTQRRRSSTPPPIQVKKSVCVMCAVEHKSNNADGVRCTTKTKGKECGNYFCRNCIMKMAFGGYTFRETCPSCYNNKEAKKMKFNNDQLQIQSLQLQNAQLTCRVLEQQRLLDSQRVISYEMSQEYQRIIHTLYGVCLSNKSGPTVPCLPRRQEIISQLAEMTNKRAQHIQKHGSGVQSEDAAKQFYQLIEMCELTDLNLFFQKWFFRYGQVIHNEFEENKLMNQHQHQQQSFPLQLPTLSSFTPSSSSTAAASAMSNVIPATGSYDFHVLPAVLDNFASSTSVAPSGTP